MGEHLLSALGGHLVDLEATLDDKMKLIELIAIGDHRLFGEHRPAVNLLGQLLDDIRLEFGEIGDSDKCLGDRVEHASGALSEIHRLKVIRTSPLSPGELRGHGAAGMHYCDAPLRLCDQSCRPTRMAERIFAPFNCNHDPGEFSVPSGSSLILHIGEPSAGGRGPVLLASGHRPFFLLCAIFGAAALPLWLAALAGYLPLSAAWHGLARPGTATRWYSVSRRLQFPGF